MYLSVYSLYYFRIKKTEFLKYKCDVKVVFQREMKNYVQIYNVFVISVYYTRNLSEFYGSINMI